MSEFKFNISEGIDGISTLNLTGRLVEESLAAEMLTVVDAFIAKGNHNIIVNLAKLEYINSSGLNSLVNILTKARSKGGDVALSSLSEKVKSLFIVTKLNTVFTVVDSVEEATASFISKEEEA